MKRSQIQPDELMRACGKQIDCVGRSNVLDSKKMKLMIVRVGRPKCVAQYEWQHRHYFSKKSIPIKMIFNAACNLTFSPTTISEIQWRKKTNQKANICWNDDKNDFRLTICFEFRLPLPWITYYYLGVHSMSQWYDALSKIITTFLLHIRIHSIRFCNFPLGPFFSCRVLRINF